MFLDRDGTVIVEREYLSAAQGVELVPGGPAALRRLREAGFLLVLVTNQSGIARGLYTEADFLSVQRRLEALLARHAAGVDRTYYCPHHPDFTGPCGCRKPGTELYRRAAADLGLALEDSWYVGDRVKDVLPARELGGRGVLVRTGYGLEHELEAPDDVVVVDDLSGAATLILREVDPSRGAR